MTVPGACAEYAKSWASTFVSVLSKLLYPCCNPEDPPVAQFPAAPLSYQTGVGFLLNKLPTLLPPNSFWNAMTPATSKAILPKTKAFKASRLKPPSKIGTNAKILKPAAAISGRTIFLILARPNYEKKM